MNDRIKQVRLSQDMTQETFAKRLGITGAAISRIEKGERGASNQVITSICREWNINEEWLRTGKGSMFIELSKSERAAKAVASKLMTDNQFILNTFITLGEMSDEDWAKVEKFVDKLASKNEQKNKE